MIFLPIVLILDSMLRKVGNIKTQKIFLIVISSIFYAWTGIQYLVLMLATVFVNWFLLPKKNASSSADSADSAVQVSSGESKQVDEGSRTRFITAIIIDVLILAFFKYYNFFVNNIELLVSSISTTAVALNEPVIPLPMGISFYTFQIIAFQADYYHGKIRKVGVSGAGGTVGKISFLDYLLYMTFFPKLIEGPILRYSDLENEIRIRKQGWIDQEYGIRRFIIGLAKKVLIVDKLLPLINSIFEVDPGWMSSSIAWLGAICYMLVIYFDFSGYTDMAIGVSSILGFRLPENFDYPYISCSIQEFWRRWHSTLGSWFRDYVYIPLGGNRKGKVATYRNLMIVFLLTGIWHGANWTFVVWGLYHGVWSLIEHLGLKNVLKKLPKVLCKVYCMLVVIIGWVFFRSDNLDYACRYIWTMFGGTSTGTTVDLHPGIAAFMNNFSIEVLVMIIIGVVLSTPVMRWVLDKSRIEVEKTETRVVVTVLYIVLLIVCIAAVMANGFSPSIYMKF